MKRLKFIWLLLIFSSSVIAQNSLFDGEVNTTKKVLILMHPTVYNIQNFTWLQEHQIVNLENTELVGLFFENERYNYSQSIKYIDSLQIQNWHLQKISGKLSAENTFTENELTNNFEKVFNLSNGIIFFGGPDIPPYLYGDKTNLLTEITDPQRHFFEASFLFHLLGGSQNENYIPLLEKKSNYIVWAFCLGMQTMNVAAGGTLYQDIPTEIYGLNTVEDILKMNENDVHKNYNKPLTWDEEMTGAHLHKIKFIEDGFFTAKLSYSTNKNPKVYSYHHQCIKELGKNLKTEATSMDGKIIEAVSHIKYPNVIAFQFHPEKYSLYDENKTYLSTFNDTTKISFYHELKQSNSLQFNKSLWTYFSEIFNE
ncbi:MAG: gamma-glutamyl-gamma-aminobutyrate hydrolase family protein [Chlorobi bacterium]|nr:gamma-glutamyl-gamma-aminobutyrate hydrolase family protein [Chlorobiota bacterium]